VCCNAKLALRYRRERGAAGGVQAVANRGVRAIKLELWLSKKKRKSSSGALVNWGLQFVIVLTHELLFLTCCKVYS
jgi:hypothetical protein